MRIRNLLFQSIIFIVTCLNVIYSQELNLITEFETPGQPGGIFINNSHAYIADRSSLQILDISDPINPLFIGEYLTANETWDVKVQDSIAYLANHSGGLQIVDISNPSSPVLLGTYDDLSFTYSVYVRDSLAYVPNYNDGLTILNVSDPTNPVFIGRYQSSGAMDVVVLGDYAYVADRQGGFKIVDISDPVNPVLAGHHITRDFAWGISYSVEYPNYMFVSSGEITLDRGRFQIFDVSDPANPLLIGFYDTPDPNWGNYIIDNYAFLACERDGLLLINISDLANPIFVDEYDTPGNSFDVSFFDNYCYVADNISLLVFGTGINYVELISPQDSILINDAFPTYFWRRSELYHSNYKVYWDDNITFSSPDSSGDLTDTSFTDPDSLNRSAHYYWRVLAFNDSGDSISSYIWRFYINGYPTMPAILDPDNGDNVDLSTYLSWLVSEDPDSFDIASYTIQIDEDSLFGSPEVDQSGLSSGLSLDDAFAIMLGDLDDIGNLLVDTRYFWRIKADDNYGLSSPWPDSLHWFNYLPQNHPPAPPTSGFSPTADEEIISLTPTITWDDAIDPDPDDNGDNLIYYFHLIEDTSTGGYEYYDITDPGINQVTIAEEIPDNSHFLYLVKTVDDEGLESQWSTLQWFWTNHHNFPPEPFPIHTPTPDLRWVDYYTYFNWGGTVDYDPLASFDYTIQVSPDSLFDYYVYEIDELADTSLRAVTDTIALAGQNLYWRVLAIDDDSLVQTGGLPEPEIRLLTIVPPGDANGDGLVIGSDVTYLVAYFRGINAPPDPFLAGDANADCMVIGSDVTRLVNYFRGIGGPLQRGDCEGASLRLGKVLTD
ncbi:MAG: hypothetical protein GY839_20575 [candidate division Zixibacteria bacterium]|nr:hypothetical protein [candidate division Zixibacteria bacterium]